MTFVVFLSTMSFTMNMHYCGDALVETVFFKDAQGCGMKMDIPLDNDCSVSKENCCSDKQIAADGIDDLKQSLEHLTLKQQQFVALLTYTYYSLFKESTQSNDTFLSYKPPLVYKQIYKVDESYLI